MTAALADFEGRALDLDAAKAAFDRDGFLVIPGALSPAQVAATDKAFRDLLAEHPEDFARFSESFITAPDILTRTEAFDHLIETPMVLALMGKLIGPRFSIEELSLILREPTDDVGELKGWHRDIIRAYDRRFEIDPISVVYYLTDVGPSDHCFSIVSGTHGPRADMRPEDVTPGMEFDALGPAGSAFVFHARCIHGGKLKLGSKARRTVHLYYGSTDKPRTSEWTNFPDRLANRQAPGVPPTLYAKTRRTDVIDGVGRRPRDIPPGLSTAEQLIRVQRAANRKPGAM